MKTFKNKLVTEFPVSEHNDVEIYTKYLNNNIFRGFYYDTDDKSYGIVLDFSQHRKDCISLFAQASKSGTIITEYEIHSENFAVEQMAYDKILVSVISYDKKILFPEKGILEIPGIVEFTLQVLTRNSVYLRFLNHELFTPPISSFQGGLVLSLDHHNTRNENPIVEIEAGEWNC